MENVSKQQSYRPPARGRIKAAVSALLPDVDPKIIQGQDWWRLYSIHQDIVKDGKSPRSAARKHLEGWKPSVKRPGAK